MTCGRVDAAFSFENNYYLVCGDIYAKLYFLSPFNLHVDYYYRPFWEDFSLIFTPRLHQSLGINAAFSYPVGTGTGTTTRFFMGDEFVDYREGQQLLGTPLRIPPLHVDDLKGTCSDSNCLFCSRMNPFLCYACLAPMVLHNDQFSPLLCCPLGKPYHTLFRPADR